MHPQTYSPGLTAATTAVRALLAAGWRNDSVHEMANGDTVRTMIHPSGREITAATGADEDAETKLTLAGLTLDQVAGAVTGAGLAPTEPEHPQPAEPDLRQRFAAELHRIADDIVEQNLPIPTFSLRIGGCVESRADAQAWADFLGVDIKMGGTAGNIPVAEKAIKVDDGRYLNLAFQGPSETHPIDAEKQRLLDRVAELEAQLAEGGADR